MVNFDVEPIGIASIVKLGVLGLKLGGTLTIIAGAAIATGSFLREALSGGGYEAAYHSFRANVSSSILLGFGFLVVGEVLKSLVLDPTFRNVLVLVGLILIWAFLSLSFGLEINGRRHWRDEVGQ